MVKYVSTWREPHDDILKGATIKGKNMLHIGLLFAMSLCASVYMCFVVTCWERADLLALVCGV